MRQRKKILACCAGVCVVVMLLTGCVSADSLSHGRNVAPVDALTMQLHAADRVELIRTAFGAQPQATWWRGGREAVHDFLRSVPILRSEGTNGCECPGGYVLNFYTGEKLLVMLSVHHFRTLRWHNGSWSGDAFLMGRPSLLLWDWVTRNGGSSLVASGNSKPLSDFVSPEPEKEVNERFLSCFPDTVRTVLSGRDLTEWTFEPRWVANNLLQSMPDGVALADAGFRALGGLSRTWLLDDAKTGMVQTALASLEEATWQAALTAHEGDVTLRRGAARVYFRFGLERRFTPEFNRHWLPKLADATLTTGTDHDRSLLLIYLGAGGEAGRAFLRKLAAGTAEYRWPTTCGGFDDTLIEPSLAASASVILSLRGEQVRRPPGRRSKLSGLDPAAWRLIDAIHDPRISVGAESFFVPSHILGYAAAEVLTRRSSGDISLEAIESGLAHRDKWVAQRVREMLQRHGVGSLDRHGWAGSRFTPVKDSLVADDPQEAIRRCTLSLSGARDGERGRLLTLRAEAYARLRNYELAGQDLKLTLKVLGVDPLVVRHRLVWVELYRGKLAEAISHADILVKLNPSAEVLLLRGMAKFACGKLDLSTEMDFAAAMQLDPSNGYAPIFQHLVACLSGREQQSRLRDVAKQEGNVYESWTPMVVGFFNGEISADKLHEQAQDWNAQPQLAAEAHFYVAQKARLDGDMVTERSQLEACVAKGFTELIEHQIAMARLAQLRQ